MANNVDIAPDLYREIEKEFKSGTSSDKGLARLLTRITSGKGTQADVSKAAARIGKHASAALKNVLTVDALPDGMFYWNIGEKTIDPLMRSIHKVVNSLGAAQMKSADAAKGIAIAIKAGPDPTEQIRGIIGSAVNARNAEELANALDVTSESENLVDQFQEANMKTRTSLGFEQYVVRTYDGVGLKTGECDWCLERAGTWTYKEAEENGVFERHKGCGCTIEVVTADDLGDDFEDVPF